jgi:hypothetical protein
MLRGLRWSTPGIGSHQQTLPSRHNWPVSRAVGLSRALLNLAERDGTAS